MTVSSNPLTPASLIHSRQMDSTRRHITERYRIVRTLSNSLSFTFRTRDGAQFAKLNKQPQANNNSRNPFLSPSNSAIPARHRHRILLRLPPPNTLLCRWATTPLGPVRRLHRRLHTLQPDRDIKKIRRLH
jgi:hypothetical protein